MADTKKVLKFELSELFGIGMLFVVIGIGMVYGLNVLSDVKTDMKIDCQSPTTYNSTAGVCYYNHAPVYSAHYNSSVDSITGVSKFPQKLPLIATVVVAAIIIGILIRYLMVRM